MICAQSYQNINLEKSRFLVPIFCYRGNGICQKSENVSVKFGNLVDASRTKQNFGPQTEFFFIDFDIVGLSPCELFSKC